jgi:hypothetical protein
MARSLAANSQEVLYFRRALTGYRAAVAIFVAKIARACAPKFIVPLRKK